MPSKEGKNSAKANKPAAAACSPNSPSSPAVVENAEGDNTLDPAFRQTIQISNDRCPTASRAVIKKIYESYQSEGEMRTSDLVLFLKDKQLDLTANSDKATELIDSFETDEKAKAKRSMTFAGFLRYMNSPGRCVNDITNNVYQDMNQPLNHYFISSSHNTYLTGNQCRGPSDSEAYMSALKAGCRCLEIDCWDGPDSMPIVYHGHTLTSKIGFQEVIDKIDEHAFECSAYPVILSLENHCSKDQQIAMARALKTTFKTRLLTTAINDSSATELPSPNDLREKILIKDKKLKAQTNAPSASEDDRHDADQQLLGSKVQQEDKMARELSDLVIYTESVKFSSFTDASVNQTCNQNTSMSENKARKLIKEKEQEFVQHTKKYLSKIYPGGYRTCSSNYNPQEFWNIGAQIVTLNFQTPGLPMDLNDGLFRDNGGCGFVLKPRVLVAPISSKDEDTTKKLHLTVITASDLPCACPALNTFVKVEIHGHRFDDCNKRTRTNINSPTPFWNEEMNFTIKVPELCMIRFSVRHQKSLFKGEFVAQYTLRFSCLRKGYVWVPLQCRERKQLGQASLFVHVSY